MRISEIASTAKYRMDEQLQIPDLKNSRNLLIFQFGIFKNLQFRKFEKFVTWKIPRLSH